MFWRKDHTETEKFFQFALCHLPFIVFDTETTGKSSSVDRVVQFSANRYDVVGGKYALTSSMNIYIKPPFQMSQEVVDIHGITNSFLEDKECEQEAFPKIRAFLEQPGCVLAGYNIIKFDNKFLIEMYARNNATFPENLQFIDIYKAVKEVICPNDVKEVLEKKYLPNTVPMRELYSLKLSNIVQFFHIDEEFGFHSAEEDIAATWRCGVELLKKYKNDFNIRKGTRIPWEEKERAVLLSLSSYKKSSTINRVYAEVLCCGARKEVYYDVRLGGWVDTEGFIVMSADMEALNNDAESLCKSLGFSGLEKFSGFADGSALCQGTA